MTTPTGVDTTAQCHSRGRRHLADGVMGSIDSQSHPRRMRRPTIHKFPPCARTFSIHYRGDDPVGLEIDGRYFVVRPLRRSVGVRAGDEFLYVTRPLEDVPAAMP